MGYETFHRNCLCIFDIIVLNIEILNIQYLFHSLVSFLIVKVKPKSLKTLMLSSTKQNKCPIPTSNMTRDFELFIQLCQSPGVSGRLDMGNIINDT